VSRATLADFHGPRLEALASAKPDLLAIETIPSLDEALLVLDLLEAWPELTAWVSFTCQDAFRVSEGQPVAEAIAGTEDQAQVVAVGFNCVAPRLGVDLVGGAARVTNKPLVLYPNSGERWDADGRRWVPGDAAADFGAAAVAWHQAGARLIGGCCRTTPDTIRAIRRALVSR
jgi:homocysteine S-methyltransferase